MKDPEFFKRYFYKVSVVRQEFYKGCSYLHSCIDFLTSFNSRALRGHFFFDLPSTVSGIQLAHIRSVTASSAPSADSQFAAVSRTGNAIVCCVPFIVDIMHFLNLRFEQQAATSAGGEAGASQVRFDYHPGILFNLHVFKAGVESGQNDETKSADAHSSRPEAQVALASKSDLDDELDAYLA
jgi:hypothetical protein